MKPMRVVNLAPFPRRMGQGNYISTGDFNVYVAQANSSIRKIADIARAYELTDEDEQIVNSELGKVTGFTVPMAKAPSCDEGPDILPLVAVGLVGLLVGIVV